jgi:type III restriction enzyme
MLKKIKDLQSNAVDKLIKKVSSQNEVTFKAPTGSGKTFMMADFMDRLLIKSDTIFIVSTLSKAGLGKQNYEKFVEYSKTFKNINPYIINSEISEEEKLYIPDDFNVYVLPRDLYKDKSRIKNNNALINFLITQRLSGKEIYLIRDESHVATNNLDSLNEYFKKIINFSATPKFEADVEISDQEAIDSKLVKKIADESNVKDEIYSVNQNDTIEDAIDKFIKIKEDYINKLKINPCLIIQISNKEKAEEEWIDIKRIIHNKNINLKWMYIVDDNAGRGSDTNDDVKKLPVSKWKDYVKNNESLIDIIIFKMVITEGWDIPRACMLYQIRDSKSKQLDEQVIGRVRRNPILLNFEKFDEESQKLALTAWIWGIYENNLRKFKKVTINKSKNFEVVTTKLTDMYKSVDFNFNDYLKNYKFKTNTSSVFELNKKWNEVSDVTAKNCWKYIKDFKDWLNISNIIDEIDKENNSYLANYETSLSINKKVFFPETSYFEMTNIVTEIDNWTWELNNKDDDEYHFDSQAEKEFAKLLKKLKTSNWGKNFYPNSSINFEYILYSKHNSYPDFILKDKFNIIHIFEVKSVNKAFNSNINEEEYDQKIVALKNMFTFASKVTEQVFYLPIKNDMNWIIYMFNQGVEQIFNEEKFVEYITNLIQ